MTTSESTLAAYWGRLRCEQPQALFYRAEHHGDSGLLRQALRQAGVPALEINNAPAAVREAWLYEAKAVSEEFLVPVVIFADGDSSSCEEISTHVQEVADQVWLETRLVALTQALDRSALNLETRRSREKKGCIRVGWQTDGAQSTENCLQLAWSSPLPLRRIRDFSARCPALTISGPGVDVLGAEIAAQGISTVRWRFEVK